MSAIVTLSGTEIGTRSVGNFQECISPGVISPPSADITPTSPPETWPFAPLTEEINPSLSTKPAVTGSEGDARPDNTDLPRDPPK